MLFYDKYWSKYILHRWNKMRTTMTHILNAGWKIWVNECLCIILATIHLTMFVSLSKLLKFAVFIEWNISNLQLQEPRRMINVCITVASDNYLCLNYPYLYHLISILFCLKIILRTWIGKEKNSVCTVLLSTSCEKCCL